MNAQFFMWSMLVMFTIIWIFFVILFFINRNEGGIVVPLLLVFVLCTLLALMGFAHIRSPYHTGGFLFPPSMTYYLLAFSGICTGLCLFFLKQQNQTIYGMVEIFVAVAVLLITAHGLNVNAFATNVLGFVSGIYVFIRGVTNFSEYFRRSREP